MAGQELDDGALRSREAEGANATCQEQWGEFWVSIATPGPNGATSKIAPRGHSVHMSRRGWEGVGGHWTG